MKSTSLLVLFSTTIALASFGPNVRIDHQNQSRYSCCNCAITVGPGAPSEQPLYVAFEGDSVYGRDDIWFQKSLDGGRTWLAEDLLIKRGDRYAMNPDITTDSDGNVYIVFTDEYVDTVGTRHYHISCVRSSDGGTTWTAPARVDDDSVRSRAIGWARIAADSAGNLFCAWNSWRTGSGHIWSSVSTDRGATWRQNIRVDDDTTDEGSYHTDVFVQPGTNHYLVTASVYCWVGGHINRCAFLYRSTDRGLTFQPGVQLDTFNCYTGFPHVVADRDHIICDYTGSGESLYGHQNFTESRTFYSGPDTWGGPVSVANLDSLHHLYYGGALALSADGHVHTALMVCDTADWRYEVYYSSTSDHGVSWSDIELVNDDTICNGWYPDIGADMAGHAYVVWTDGGEIWFSTNNPAGIAEEPMRPVISAQPSATVVRGVLVLDGLGTRSELPERNSVMSRAALLDIGGRQVMVLRPGANDVRALAPGVYFVRQEPQAASPKPQAVYKVIITR